MSNKPGCRISGGVLTPVTTCSMLGRQKPLRKPACEQYTLSKRKGYVTFPNLKPSSPLSSPSPGQHTSFLSQIQGRWLSSQSQCPGPFSLSSSFGGNGHEWNHPCWHTFPVFAAGSNWAWRAARSGCWLVCLIVIHARALPALSQTLSREQMPRLAGW